MPIPTASGDFAAFFPMLFDSIRSVSGTNGGVDPEEWSGFAFGCGLERVAQLRHNLPDIRLLWENDLRFMEQYR